MNEKRRVALKESHETLSSLYEQLEGVKDEIEERRDEEDDYIYNMAENLQGSERYDQAVGYYYAMDIAIDELDRALGYIESAINYLKEITGA